MTLASSWGPKADTVARIGRPGPIPPRARKATGKPDGLHSTPSSPARRATPSRGWPGRASPDRSPFTSAANTGTPMADSCSAISCRVLVLPVPVAPAIRPWRFIMATGTWTTASAATAPPCTPRPSPRAAPPVA